MQRRTLLKLGLAAATVLAATGGALSLVRPAFVDGRMTPSGRMVFEAVARAVLDGSLPQEAGLRRAALSAHLQRLDTTLSALPPATRAELAQLLALLASSPGRAALAGLHTDWPDAQVAELQDALQGMRTSSLALRQQAYHALRDLTNAAYYADPSTWSSMGYPGPRDV
jgi:hypothetical protein